MDKAWAEPVEADEEEEGEEDEAEEDAPDPNAPKSVEVVIELPRSRPSGTLVLTGARLITMKGDEIIDSGIIVVEDNRIAAIGRHGGDIEIPAGARVIDASGLTAIPGLVDAHAHMGYGGLDINPQRDWRYFANLAYGVTTTMDPSAVAPLVMIIVVHIGCSASLLRWDRSRCYLIAIS